MDHQHAGLRARFGRLTSRRKILVTFWLPVAVALLMLATAVLMARIANSLGSEATAQMMEQQRETSNASWARLQHLTQLSSDGKLTQEQLMKEMNTLNDQTAAQLSAAGNAWTNKMSQLEWLRTPAQIMAWLALPILLTTLVVYAIARAYAARLHRDLRMRGYETLEMSDAVWLCVALRHRAASIPPAGEMLTVPGYDGSAASIIAFCRMRARHRRNPSSH